MPETRLSSWPGFKLQRPRTQCFENIGRKRGRLSVELLCNKSVGIFTICSSKRHVNTSMRKRYLSTFTRQAGRTSGPCTEADQKWKLNVSYYRPAPALRFLQTPRCSFEMAQANKWVPAQLRVISVTKTWIPNKHFCVHNHCERNAQTGFHRDQAFSARTECF